MSVLVAPMHLSIQDDAWEACDGDSQDPSAGEWMATYRVVWRAGGSRRGVWESETFAGKAAAGRFRRDVDLAGQLWPQGWVKGVGYRAADVDQHAPVPLLADFAHAYVRDLTGITPAPRHRYDRQALLVVEQLRTVLRSEPTVANVEQLHIRRWVNAREAAGARPKTVANHHELLFMILPRPPVPACERGTRATAPGCRIATPPTWTGTATTSSSTSPRSR